MRVPEANDDYTLCYLTVLLDFGAKVYLYPDLALSVKMRLLTLGGFISAALKYTLAFDPETSFLSDNALLRKGQIQNVLEHRPAKTQPTCDNVYRASITFVGLAKDVLAYRPYRDNFV
jgi:hypothetical protein